MAMSAGMAGAGAGASMMSMQPLGGHLHGPPQPFLRVDPPPGGPQEAATGGASAGRPGAGGAYDLRSWEKDLGQEEDLHACLGVDVGTSNIKACLYLRDGGCKAIGGKSGAAGLAACVLVDSKSGVKGVRRWLKSRASGASVSATPPKGLKLFHSASSDDKGAVVWPLRLMALRGKGAEATQRVQSSLRHEIKISPEHSRDPEDAETSGVRIQLTSPDAPDEKDREMWCTAEEVLAMLLAGIKAKAEEAHGVVVKTCYVSAPSCLADLQRVALQRSVFLAGMEPRRFVGGPLAATVGFLWGRASAEINGPEDLIVSISMGSSFLDVAVIAPSRGAVASADEATVSSADDVTSAAGGGKSSSASETVAGGKKKKKKGKSGSGGKEAGAGAAEGMGFVVKALAGDSACGGLDMDYLVARALLAAVEDSTGPEIAADRTLWQNLLGSAKVLRERLSSEVKSSCNLKAGCCDADPSFKHTLELSQSEMEAAVAGTVETFGNTLQRALDRAGATPGEVKTVVLHGICGKTPALLDEVVKVFVNAQIEHPGPGDCAKGAALLLAASRGLLTALPVKATDALYHKLGLVDRCKKSSGTMELFPAGTSTPASKALTFNGKTSGCCSAINMEVVQWVEEGGSSQGGKGSGGRWVTVQRLGNPLAIQDDSGYPVLAAEAVRLFSLDECGICVNELKSAAVPDKKKGAFRVGRLLNQAAILLAMLAVLGGGYWLLYRMEHAGERRQASARIRLTAFYEEHNPEKLDSIEEALARYKGREDVLFQRLKLRYGKPVPP